MRTFCRANADVKMAKSEIMRTRIANIITNAFNPFVTGSLGLFALGFYAGLDAGEIFKWWAIILGITILPVFFALSWMLRSRRIDSLRAGRREQRTPVYLSAIFVIGIDFVALQFTKAPHIYVSGIGIGLLGIGVFTCINLIWKISLHAGFAMALVLALYFSFGPAGLLSIMILLIVGWARVELKEHTVWQVVAGAVAAAGVGAAGLKIWGLV